MSLTPSHRVPFDRIGPGEPQTVRCQAAPMEPDHPPIIGSWQGFQVPPTSAGCGDTESAGLRAGFCGKVQVQAAPLLSDSESGQFAAT